MSKIKNLIGSFVFLVSTWFMMVSMNWIMDDKSRLAAIDETIKIGKAAEIAKSKWNILTKN